MWDTLYWLYLANGTPVIVHEIDSAYWKEWEFFGIPGGLSFFLLLHIPLVGALLYGFSLVISRSFGGLLASGLVAAVGFIAFGLHTYFLRAGRPEFRAPVSIGILVAALLLSLGQVAAVARAWDLGVG